MKTLSCCLISISIFKDCRLSAAVLSAAITNLASPFAATSYGAGPNLVADSSFESGGALWTKGNVFTMKNDRANAHTGSWVVEAALGNGLTNDRLFKPLTIWPNTDYVTSVWVKGAGELEMRVTKPDHSGSFAVKNFVATEDWQKVTLAWNSGTYSGKGAMPGIRDAVKGGGPGIVYLDDFETGVAEGKEMDFNAADPAKSGLKLLFSDEFDSIETIDADNTGKAGFKWYVAQYWGFPAATPAMYSVADGALTIKDCPNSWGSTLHTTGPNPALPEGFHGTAFSAGKGIYFESRIAFMNVDAIARNAWPAFWSMDVKMLTRLNQEMPGNPGYKEQMEDDFMEYNPGWGLSGGYYSTIHDWNGPLKNGKEQKGNDFGNGWNHALPQAPGTDFTEWHTYGVLWVPGTAENGWIGYRQAFFDGVPQAAVCWKANQVGAYPPSGSYLFSLMQQDKFDVILGSCAGGTPTMKVDYVRVYAASPESMTVVAGDPSHEAERLENSGATDTVELIKGDASASMASAVRLASDAVGDKITFMLPVREAGEYSIKVRSKNYTTRGVYQLSIDGMDQGPAIDQYGDGEYVEADLGTKAFGDAGDKAFTFSVVGKNEKSSGYDLVFDYIKLTPLNSATKELGRN